MKRKLLIFMALLTANLGAALAQADENDSDADAALSGKLPNFFYPGEPLAQDEMRIIVMGSTSTPRRGQRERRLNLGLQLPWRVSNSLRNGIEILSILQFRLGRGMSLKSLNSIIERTQVWHIRIMGSLLLTFPPSIKPVQ